MRINFKQQQLLEELFNRVKGKFPEIYFHNIIPNPEDPDHALFQVINDMNEIRLDELREYSSDLEADILQEYGYFISIMPSNRDYPGY
jgi:hypothetical protein